MGISLCIPTRNSGSGRVSQKERNMLHNGGLLLEELLHSCDGKCNPFRIFPAKELAQATNHYQEMFVETDYGRMYRGFINGCPIIVKCTRGPRNIALEEAINEIVFASQLNNHKNVLMLLGCCLETKVPVLVYEYAENGILLDRIRTPSLGSHNHQQLLPWNCRLKVAKEIADSLDYLHTGLSTPIVHRDIKPRNIFLDGNYGAKLSEFGLSVLIPPGEEFIKTHIAGTQGYIDPEYWSTGQLSEKCDVYSFGSLLFEILSGERYQSFWERFNTDHRGMSKSESNLALSGAFKLVDRVGTRDPNSTASNQGAIDLTYISDEDDYSYISPASSTFEQDLLREVDKEYLHQAIVEAAEKYIGPENMLESHLKQSMPCSELVLQCVKRNALERPTMTEVAKELRRIIRFQ